jgi:hypothetical protein
MKKRGHEYWLSIVMATPYHQCDLRHADEDLPARFDDTLQQSNRSKILQGI